MESSTFRRAIPPRVVEGTEEKCPPPAAKIYTVLESIEDKHSIGSSYNIFSAITVRFARRWRCVNASSLVQRDSKLARFLHGSNLFLIENWAVDGENRLLLSSRNVFLLQGDPLGCDGKAFGSQSLFDLEAGLAAGFQVRLHGGGSFCVSNQANRVWSSRLGGPSSSLLYLYSKYCCRDDVTGCEIGNLYSNFWKKIE